MPSLFRLLAVLGVIGGVIAGSLYVLAEYFQPEPKEISKGLRNVKARIVEEEQTGTTQPAQDTTATAPAETDSAGAE